MKYSENFDKIMGAIDNGDGIAIRGQYYHYTGKGFHKAQYKIVEGFDGEYIKYLDAGVYRGDHPDIDVINACRAEVSVIPNSVIPTEEEISEFKEWQELKKKFRMQGNGFIIE